MSRGPPSSRPASRNGGARWGSASTTNLATLRAHGELARITERIQSRYRRLSSGLRIPTAADDPSGLAVAERMQARLRSTSAAVRNVEDGTSLLQTVEGALARMQDLVARMRELAVHSLNGTHTAGDRAILDREYQGARGGADAPLRDDRVQRAAAALPGPARRRPGRSGPG